MGWEAPLPFSSNPEADPFILKENKQKTHDLEYSFQCAGPFLGPAGCARGRELEGEGAPPRRYPLRPVSPPPSPCASPVIYEACHWPCSGCSFPGQSPALTGCIGTEATVQTSRPLSARSLTGEAGSAGGHRRPPGLEPSTGPAFSGGLREGHGPDPSWGQRLGRDLRFSSELCPLPLLLPQHPSSQERAAGLGTSPALCGALPVPRAGVPALDSPAVFSFSASCPYHLYNGD